MHYQQNLKQLARSLRSNQTDAEKALWQHIRGKQILGVQFYRQRPLLNYIVDFYCHAAQLVLECDGGYHAEAEQQQQDTLRDARLASMGIAVLRLRNEQVLQHPTWVVDEITRCVAARLGIQP